MARPQGARNADHQQVRDALLDAAIPRLTAREAARPSLRELSAAAGVSVSTLRHYFDDREGLVEAAFARLRALGEEHVGAGRLLLDLPPERALLAWSLNLVEGWLEHGVGALFSAALAEGMNQPRLGPACVQELLEPMIQACEALLEGLHARGALSVPDARLAALQLVSPLFVALLHQDSLGGAACRPLDLRAFTEAHVASFVAARAAPPEGPGQAPPPGG